MVQPDRMLVTLAGRGPALRPALDIASSDDGFVIDARHLEWASPADLTAIAALHASWAPSGPVRLVLPDNPDTASYLQRMDILRHLGDAGAFVDGDPGADERRDQHGRLLELRPIRSRADIDLFASDVFALVSSCVDHHQAALAHGMLGELLDNTLAHAQSAGGAFGAAQVYTGRTTGEAGIEVAVSDSGIGILDSLRQNPANHAIADCAHAVQAALRKGVTGEINGSGNGLYDVVHQLPSQRGTLLLRSGDGLARVTPAHRTITATTTATPGTWAWLRLIPPTSPADGQA